MVSPFFDLVRSAGTGPGATEVAPIDLGVDLITKAKLNMCCYANYRPYSLIARYCRLCYGFKWVNLTAAIQ